MTRFESFDNRVCERVLNLLEVDYLRLKEIVVDRITIIEIGVNDGDCNGRGYYGIEVRVDIAKLVWRDIRSGWKSEMQPRLQAE